MATNYEQAGIEAVNRLFKPMAAGMAAQQGLQRRAGEMALRRQTQLDDASTLRDQQLTDAATLREQKLTDAATLRTQQLADQETAQANRLDLLETELEERNRLTEDTFQKRRAEKLKDDKDEAAAMLDSLSKKGISLGFSITDLNKASRGELNSFMRELSLESEIVKLNKKPHAELLERLRSIERTDEGKDILQQLWGTADAIDWEEVAKESKSTLADVLGEATIKLNLQKYGKGPVIEYKKLRVIQHKLMQETGIYDLMMSENPTNESAAKAIANDMQFQLGLTQALKDGWMPGDDRPEKANRILDLLQGGQLMAAAQMLDNEGVAGNTPLVEAYTKWAQTSQVAQQAKIQDRIFRSQGSIQKLREVNQQLNGLVSRHDWLERAVDLTDIPEIMNDLQGMQGGGVNPPVSMEPGDPGFGDNAGGTSEGLAPVNDIVNLVNPAANATATTTEVPRTRVNLSDTEEAEFQNFWNNNPNVQAWKKDLGNPNKSPDDIEDKYDYRAAWKGGDVPQFEAVDGHYHWGTGPSDAPWKDSDHPTFPLYNPEDYEDLSIVGGSSLATRDMSQDTMSAPTQSWFGRKATELKQAIAPRTDLSFISPSMAPLYDDPDAGPGGMGDLAVEIGNLAGMAWLGTKGFSMLGKSPAALKRVKDLSKANPGGIPVGELARALGGGAALESLKAFLKNPKKMKTIMDQIKQSAPLRSRMHGGGAKPYELIPKQRRLDFTPPSRGHSIITPSRGLTPPSPPLNIGNLKPTQELLPGTGIYK